MTLIILCAAALAGLAVGDLAPARLEPSRLAFTALVGMLGAIFAWRRPAWRLLALVTCATALGGLRAFLSAPEPATRMALEPYVGRVVRLRGEVLQMPVISSTGASELVTVQAHAVGPSGTRDPTSIAATPLRVVGDPPTLSVLRPGEMLELDGRLLSGEGRAPPTLLFPTLVEHQPPAAFDAARLLADVRSKAEGGIRRYLPEPQASLAVGVLLGGSGRLDADFRLHLQRSGLAHVVAIDGFKQVVVAAALGGVAVRVLGARSAAATLTILLGIAGYTLLTGAHPSAVRAGLMVGLATLASLSGRLADPLTSLLLAVLVMAAVEPRILLDVGLQLSLAAVLGIVLLWPRLRRRLRGVPRLVAEPAGLTLAVSLATLPVVLSDFQMVSLVSPVAHVLAVPLLPPVLVGAALLAAASPIEPLANIVRWAAWLPTTLLVQVIQVLGDLPGAALSTGRLPPLAAGCLALFLLAWGVWGLPELAPLRLRWTRGRTSLEGWWTPAACTGVCLSAAALVGALKPDGRLHIQTLAAGRGEAVLIRGPTGRTTLVVGGSLNPTLLAGQVADRLAVWEHKLDGLLPLDAAAEAGVGHTLARYPADQRLDADTDGRFDLGGGVSLDLEPAAGQPQPGVSVRFGNIRLPITGRPPPQTDLVSDGIEVWDASSGEP